MQATMDAETRGLIGDTLDRLVGDVYQSAARLSRIKAGVIDYRLNWPLLAELGVLGLAYGEAQGGMGAGAADVAQALRVLARGLVLEPFAEAAVISAAVLGAGEPSQAREQAVVAASSGQRISIVVGLPRRADGPSLYRAGDTLRLQGSVQVVAYADQADEWLLAAREADSGETLVLRIARSHSGVAVRPFRLMDARPAADLCFDGVSLEPSQVWLRGTAADAALARAGDMALLAWGADALGAMEQLLRITGDYLRTRVQFGVALGTFQALQHRCADMQMDMLEVRALVQAYGRCLDDGAGAEAKATLQSALARVAARAGAHIGQEAIQMHGGMGVTEELVVSHYNARAQVLRGWLLAWTQACELACAEAV